MVCMAHQEMRSSIAAYIDHIVLSWNRFTSYTGEAHVTGMN
jgi:hypothetical protein